MLLSGDLDCIHDPIIQDQDIADAAEQLIVELKYGGIYRKKEASKGGWPLHSPNPNAHDDTVAEKLDQISRSLVGLN